MEYIYGWGQKATLFQDRLEANGTVYLLSDLLHVEPQYFRFMGITSIRLKLFFKRNKLVVLRGLAQSQPVQEMLAYLTHYTYLPTDSTREFPVRAEHKEAQTTYQHAYGASSQGSFWEYETGPFEWKGCMQRDILDKGYQNVLSLTLHPEMYAPQGTAENYTMTDGYEMTQRLKQIILPDASAPPSLDPTGTDLLELYGQFILPEIVYLPEYIEHRSVYDKLRVFGFSIEGLVLQLRQGQLPSIATPLKLLPGETAHYRTDATLCEESGDAPSSERDENRSSIKYRIKDRGAFILTNSRILYLGRKRSMLLGYGQISHISRLRDFLAFQVKNVCKRHLFEMRRPLECAIYLEYLLQCYWAKRKMETGNISYALSSIRAISATSPPSIRTRALARAGYSGR
jgi:hypothetical protein